MGEAMRLTFIKQQIKMKLSQNEYDMLYGAWIKFLRRTEYVRTKQLRSFAKGFGSDGWEMAHDLRDALEYDAEHEKYVWKKFEEEGGTGRWPEEEAGYHLPKAYIEQNAVDACHVFHAYSPHIYDLEKSERLLVEAIDHTSTRYRKVFDGLIPVIYTTLANPSGDDLDRDVWRNLQSLQSFNQEDYGHLDIDCAFTILEKKKVLKVKRMALLQASNRSITGEFYVEYFAARSQKLFGLRMPMKPTPKPSQDAEFMGLAAYDDGQIRYRGDSVDMPYRLNMICRLFLLKPNQLITFDEIADTLWAEPKLTPQVRQRIAKYVSDLRVRLKKLNTKLTLVNLQNEGWYLKSST